MILSSKENAMKMSIFCFADCHYFIFIKGEEMH